METRPPDLSFPEPEPRGPGAPSGRPAGPPLPAWAWAGLGVAVTLLALGVAQVVALLTGASTAPLVAVGDAFVDRTPPWLKDFAVATFGTNDKAVLLGGAAVVLLGLGALAGLLARRRAGTASQVVLGLGAVAALAAATRPDAGALAVLPSVVGAIVGSVALSALASRAPGAGVPSPAGSAPAGGPSSGTVPSGTADRRRFLQVLGVVGAGGAAAVVVGRAVSARLAGGTASRAQVTLPRPADPAPALPASVEVGVDGVVPFRVPNADFYRIDTALVVPQVDAASWKLRIHGMVEREVTLTYDELVAQPLVERDVTLMCVSNEVGGDLVGNARWLGLPIKPLLEKAGATAGADMVLSSSADGWTCSTPLDVLLDGRDALLAVGMNGEPLPVEHGFPVRMVVPGLYGFVSATKWVVDLEVTRFAEAQAYWTPRGWSEKAPVKTQSRIDVPAAGADVRAGTVAVAGVAWAQHRGIDAVEVRVDDGPWQPAKLGSVPSTDTWRQWVLAWDATPGRHTLAVRATDATGTPQTGDQAPPAPDGATGWHTIQVTVT
nr:molybdopterin-dependent oxidoreductase [Kineosporia sp. A_224]